MRKFQLTNWVKSKTSVNTRKESEHVNRDKINKATNTIMDSNNAKFPDDPAVTLTIRLIMQGKVSSLFISHLSVVRFLQHSFFVYLNWWWFVHYANRVINLSSLWSLSSKWKLNAFELHASDSRYLQHGSFEREVFFFPLHGLVMITLLDSFIKCGFDLD